MSKSTKKSPSKGDAPDDGATGATCVLCCTHVSPKEKATLKCGMLPEEHEFSVHVKCAEDYGTSAATSFLKKERLPAICLRLRGSGAPPNKLSVPKLKLLGLHEMLNAIEEGKGQEQINTTKGKMIDKYLKMAKKWANDRNIDKKLLLAACPHDDCKLTIKAYTPPLQGDCRAASSNVAPRKRHLLAIMATNEEADEGRCVGTKSDGMQCPRSVTESGGDVNAGLCRTCKKKADKLSALAAAAAATAAEAEATQGGAKRASTVKASEKMMTSTRESGALLKG